MIIRQVIVVSNQSIGIRISLYRLSERVSNFQRIVGERRNKSALVYQEVLSFFTIILL